jgi:hypothetical protein
MTMSFYKPLNVAQKEFRLLNLKSRLSSTLPLSEDEPLHCTTFHAIHSHLPEYQALSYTWGDEKNKVTILVDGEDFAITRNLKDVLTAIRKDNEDLVIWIDALSINQKDDDEKSTQVQMMREIYSKAENTISWLGTGSPTSDLAMVKCNVLGAEICGNGALKLMIRYIAMKGGSDDFVSLQNEVDRRLGPLLASAVQDLPATFVFLDALQELLQSSYWQRMWIQQEFVISPSILIQCGNLGVGVSHFYASFLYTILLKRYIIQHLMRNRQNSIARGDATGGDPNTFSYLSKLQNYEITFASTLLGKRRRFQDPETRPHVEGMTLMDLLAGSLIGVEVSPFFDRDRIYPLLGIASDTKELGIIPDYKETTSVNSIYIQAARAMITAGNVDLLSFAQNRERRSELPSWVPDWRDQIMKPSGGLPRNTLFAASGRHTFIPSEEKVDPHSSSISLKGYSIDVIEDLMPGWTPRPTASENYWRDLRQYLNSIRYLCNTSNSKLTDTGIDIYRTQSDREDAHIRIPVADQETNTEQFGVGGTQRATVESSKRYASALEHVRQHLSPAAVEADTAHGIHATTYITDMKDQVFRRPFIASKGYVGLVPNHADVGDVLVVFRGGKFPYVLRDSGDGTYRFVGDAYVHGIMYREFVEKDSSVEEFVLR